MMNKVIISRLIQIVLSLSIFFTIAEDVVAEKRIALVIGNAAYREAPLANPANDASDISVALQQAGFEVVSYINIDRQQMREAIRDFGNQLKKSDVGLFYFAGHGIQIKGRNYLIPLGADVHSADEVQDESIDASAVLRKMESAGNAVNIVILDACRNNPFARSFRSLDSGLARMDGPVGSFIAYATAPGSVAADGSGRNGVYTEHLLEALRVPGLTIEQTFKRVRNGVKKATSGQQIPWESSSLLGEFVFLSPLPGVIKPAIPSPPPVAMKYLQVVSNVKNATVTVNHVERGRIGDRGFLNINNLIDDEAEVVVQAKGYTTQRAKIKLQSGKWKRLSVTLTPKQSAESDATATFSDSRKSQSQGAEIVATCNRGKRALLSTTLALPQADANHIKHNAPELNALLLQAFKPYGMVFIDTEGMGRQENTQVELKSLANRHKLEYLLKVSIDVRELPIKLLKTNMKTINTAVTLESMEIKTQRILGSVSQNFAKAGLDTKSVVLGQLERRLPGMSQELLRQTCARQ